MSILGLNVRLILPLAVSFHKPHIYSLFFQYTLTSNSDKTHPILYKVKQILFVVLWFLSSYSESSYFCSILFTLLDFQGSFQQVNSLLHLHHNFLSGCP